VGNFLRLVGTLAAIAAAASFGLSAVYNATHGITEEYKRQEEALARVEALGCNPDAHFVWTQTDSIVDGRPFGYYTAYAGADSDSIVGYSFMAYGKGYSSTIETIVGVDRGGTICGIKITSQKETPGLGAKVEEVASQNTLWAVMTGHAVDETGSRPWFQIQFNGMAGSDLHVVKSATQEGILAITGATISSDAVTNSILDGLHALMSIAGLGSAAADERVGPAEGGEEGAKRPGDEPAVGGAGAEGSVS
jgi:RnfABCDGE-type electron transport complex G subunit